MPRLRITNVETLLLRVPTPHPIALGFPAVGVVAARVRTDQGLTGFGYTLVFGGGGAEAIASYLEKCLAPLVAGEDPLLVERLWERMYRADRGVRRVGLAGYALSALDIALWDIAGQAAELPLCRLWGAAADRVPAYGSGGWAAYSIDDLAGEAERYAALGCRYYKLKIHDPDPRANRERVAEVRRATGGRLRLMVDVNQKLDVAGAIRQARLLEDLDLVWYEEPVLADDTPACAEVARAIPIPVATGENLYSRYEFRDVLERGAARYLMPDVGRANGFTECLAIGRLAAAHGAAVSPHTAHELSLQLAAALPNSFLLELIDWMPPDLFTGVPRCEKGSFRVPDRPGHGIALAPGAEKRYRAG